MGSDKGVLARAIAGGFKGGNAALRQKDELTEKFLWGNEEARQARDENHARFGEAKQLATHASNLGVGAAQQTRKLKRDEGISAVQQGLKAKMEAMDADPTTIDEAVQLAGAGLSAAIIQGTPGKPLTAEGIKQISEAVDKLMPDALPEERLTVAKQFEAKITAGTYGIQKAAAAAETNREAAKETAAKKQVVDKTTTGLTKALVTNQKLAIKQFGALASKQPELAKDVLANLEAQGGYGREIKAMRRILSQGIRDTEPVLVASTMAGRPQEEAFGPGSGGVIPPQSAPVLAPAASTNSNLPQGTVRGKVVPTY